MSAIVNRKSYVPVFWWCKPTENLYAARSNWNRCPDGKEDMQFVYTCYNYNVFSQADPKDVKPICGWGNSLITNVQVKQAFSISLPCLKLPISSSHMEAAFRWKYSQHKNRHFVYGCGTKPSGPVHS